MDIGTNTEISLIHRGDIMSASCPSGPALEGGHISCGMRAAEGAIERVTVADGRLKIARSATVDAGRPVRLGRDRRHGGLAANRHSRRRRPHRRPRIRTSRRSDGRRVAVLAPGVTFTQHDVRAVQLAKAAIRTGIELLLRDRGLAEDDIELVIIAGAFGAYIDVGSAIAIGLLPTCRSIASRRSAMQPASACGSLLASRKTRAQARELAAAMPLCRTQHARRFPEAFLHNIGFKTDGETP